MSGGGTHQSLRQALGAIKDSTTIGLVKVGSQCKDLDIAVVKATNHVESLPKEKHVRTIFAATSASRPRADVAYCIHALARRLSKTHNWAVALKCLIVIHRVLREGDPSFREELINYSRMRGHILNMSYFKDESSRNAWDYSAWVRTYALFLEERLECCHVLKYDVESERVSRTKELGTVDLLEQLPALQQFLYRLMDCRPEGAAFFNYAIQYALNFVLRESIKLYLAINEGTINLVDKFFEMQHHDAIKAFEIYKRAGKQTERLSEFYEACKCLDLSRSLKFPPLEQPPQSFLSTMEEYVRDTSRHSSAIRREFSENDSQAFRKIQVIPDLEHKKTPKTEEAPPLADASPKEIVRPVPFNDNIDLLGLGDPNPKPSALEEGNALALAIISSGPTLNSTAATQDANGASAVAAGSTGWELALVTAPSSNGSALKESKLAGGLDRLTLDRLYEDAVARPSYPMLPGSYHLGPNPSESSIILRIGQHDPFFSSNKIAPPPHVQMGTLAQQQQAIMMQQQMMHLQQMNPYGQMYGMAYPYTAGIQHQGRSQNNPFGNPGLL